MFDVEGFILVGGASSRMGSDKSQLKFGDGSGVDLIAANLRSIASGVRLVGSHHGPTAHGMEYISDLHEHWGALGGIQAALNACESAWAAIVACDLPLVTHELFMKLWLFAKEPFDAVVPIQPDCRTQPLCAIYKRETCLGEIETLIAAGEHTPRALLANVDTRWVDFAELADLPHAENFFLNVNTPADYERAKSILVQRKRSR